MRFDFDTVIFCFIIHFIIIIAQICEKCLTCTKKCNIIILRYRNSSNLKFGQNTLTAKQLSYTRPCKSTGACSGIRAICFTIYTAYCIIDINNQKGI